MVKSEPELKKRVDGVIGKRAVERDLDPQAVVPAPDQNIFVFILECLEKRDQTGDPEAPDRPRKLKAVGPGHHNVGNDEVEGGLIHQC